MMKANDRKDAQAARNDFRKEFAVKYPKAVKSIDDNWDQLTAFFDFPALHWQYLRTTNPIESTFATVKLRIKTTKGAGSKEIAEAMTFKLMLEAQKKWRKLQGYQEIPGMLEGDLYRDGVLIDSDNLRRRAA